ncbi:hypothetical protein H8D57_02810, partial [bacterium]|nr:hypothetical protein [bacterium]
MLVEGLNFIYGVVVDGAGNESEASDSIEYFLDLAVPVVSDFEALNGPYLATGTPEFSARAYDVDSEMDPDSTTLTIIGELEVAVQFSAEDSLISAQIPGGDALGNGEYIARLIVMDLAGNPDTSLYPFEIDLDEVATPEILSFERYTSTNTVSLTGESSVGLTVLAYLNEVEITTIELTDSAQFAIEYSVPSLPDISIIELISRNLAGTESEPTDPESLFVDVDPPEFSLTIPDNGEEIDVGDFQEIRAFIMDNLSGVESDSFFLQLNVDTLEISVTETDSGFWLSSDVSEYLFTDEGTNDVVSKAYDLSNPANEQEHFWQFVTLINDAPAVAIPDSSFNEDEQLSLDLREFVSDADDAFENLTFAASIIEGDENGTINFDDEEGLLHISADEDWFGDLLIRIEVTDPGNLTGIDTSLMVVNPTNDAPNFNENIADTTAFVDQAFQINIEAADIDPDDNLTFSDNTDIFEINNEGEIVFTPDEEMIGLHNIIIIVIDESSASDSLEFNLFVTLSNQEVQIVDNIEDIIVDEDSNPAIFADLDDVFYDPDDDQLTYDIEYDPDGIWIFLNPATLELMYILDFDYYGEVEVSITADDLNGSTITDIFNITINSINDPPQQVGFLPEIIIIAEDAGQRVIADLDSVFYDPEDQDISFDWFGGEHLGVNIDEENVLTVTTDENWTGQEVITLILEDGVQVILMGQSRLGNGNPELIRDEASEFEITIYATPVNDPPEILIDEPFLVTMDEDQEPFELPLSLVEMFFDPDEGDEIIISWEELDGPISLSLNEAEDHIVATINEEDYNGEYDYPVTCTDTQEESVELVIAFTVIGINDPPAVVTQIEDLTINEDPDPQVVVIADLDDVFDDVDGDFLEFSYSEVPEDLNLEIDGENILSISPVENYNLADGIDITLTAEDGQGGFFAAELKLSGNERQELSIANHSRNIRSSKNGLTNQMELSIEPGDSGNRFTPDRDETVDEGFTLYINPENDPPLWDESEDQSVNEGQSLEVNLSADDVDLYFEGDHLTLSVFFDDGIIDLGAEFVDNDDGTGTLFWEPGYNSQGDYAVTFRVTDQEQASDDISITISVGNVNRPPELDPVG